MFNVNRVTLLGTVTGIKTQAGKAVRHFSTVRKMDRQASTIEHHRLLCVGGLAAFASDRAKKGMKLYIEGRLHTEKNTVILVDRLVLLSK